MTRKTPDAFQDRYAHDVVRARVLADGQVTARGAVVAVRMAGGLAARHSPEA
jgi:hypothetical protein